MPTWASIGAAVLLQPLLRTAVADLVAARTHRPLPPRRSRLRAWGDVRLRYAPVAAVDLARFGLWGAQLVVDARAERLEDVLSDNFALSYVRDRLTAALASDDRTQLDTALEDLQVAIDDEDFAAIADSGLTIWEFAPTPPFKRQASGRTGYRAGGCCLTWAIASGTPPVQAGPCPARPTRPPRRSAGPATRPPRPDRR